jgi:hypothetical protein
LQFKNMRKKNKGKVPKTRSFHNTAHNVLWLHSQEPIFT